MPAATHASEDRVQRAELGAHAPLLRRYLYVLGVRHDRIDDLVQEAIVVALQRRIDVREGRGDALRAFLCGVAKNLVLRERRSAAARREVELADDVWHEEPGDDARVDALRRCVGELPERSRKLLERTYADDAGRADAARELGMRADGVKTALRRLRTALRECVERRLRGGA